ncbi:MAG: MoaD/ThiS family protein [Thiogranum sp.]|nr:MoaD/ThiS family protein [Thiogranum sp.]
MRIEVRFFAGLRERLGIAEREVSVPEGTSIRQLWSLVVPEEPLPDNVLAARNMEYVDLSSIPCDGDEIAFFPPVTGGAG